MALEIEEKGAGGITILEISGRVTLGEASSQLRTKLKKVLSQDKSRVVLDMAKVGYIDSAGLWTLVACCTSARNIGAMMKLANLTNKIHQQLVTNKLVTFFEVYSTTDEAVKSFAPTS